MREILFRGKCVQNGDWIFGWYSKACYGSWPLRDAIADIDKAEDGCLGFEEVDPNTVGQFTGLIDKNGTKIFEGDIVRLDIAGIIFNAVCKFHSGSFGLVWHYMGADRWQAFTSICHVEYEVIGNVHDNPELTEDK